MLEFLPRGSWLYLPRSCFWSLGLGWETQGLWPVPGMGKGDPTSTSSFVPSAVSRGSALRRSQALLPGMGRDFPTPMLRPQLPRAQSPGPAGLVPSGLRTRPSRGYLPPCTPHLRPQIDTSCAWKRWRASLHLCLVWWVQSGPQAPDHPRVNPSSYNYSCVTLRNLINHSVLQFSYLENMDANNTYFEGFGRAT